MKIYAASKVIILHPEKKELLLMKRSLTKGAGYELIGGRVEVDFSNKKAESLEQCIVREAYEELNVRIKKLKYQGSYYFFWTIKENACSVCAVFLAKVFSIETIKQKNYEPCGSAIYPIWVKITDILNGKIFIEKHHVGLSKIITNVAVKIMNGMIF